MLIIWLLDGYLQQDFPIKKQPAIITPILGNRNIYSTTLLLHYTVGKILYQKPARCVSMGIIVKPMLSLIRLEYIEYSNSIIALKIVNFTIYQFNISTFAR